MRQCLAFLPPDHDGCPAGPGVAENPLAPAAVILLFVCAGLVGFPVTILIAATAVSFGALPGLPSAAAGALAPGRTDSGRFQEETGGGDTPARSKKTTTLSPLKA